MKDTAKHTENAQWAETRGGGPVRRHLKKISEVPEVQPGLDAPFEGASPTGAPQRPTMAPPGHAGYYSAEPMAPEQNWALRRLQQCCVDACRMQRDALRVTRWAYLNETGARQFRDAVVRLRNAAALLEDVANDLLPGGSTSRATPANVGLSDLRAFFAEGCPSGFSWGFMTDGDDFLVSWCWEGPAGGCGCYQRDIRTKRLSSLVNRWTKVDWVAERRAAEAFGRLPMGI